MSLAATQACHTAVCEQHQWRQYTDAMSKKHASLPVARGSSWPIKLALIFINVFLSILLLHSLTFLFIMFVKFQHFLQEGCWCKTRKLQLHTNTHICHARHTHTVGGSHITSVFSQHSGVCLAWLCECPGSSVSRCFNHLLRSLCWSGIGGVDNIHTPTHLCTHRWL